MSGLGFFRFAVTAALALLAAVPLLSQDIFVPEGIETAGVCRIVPDTPVYLDGEGRGALGNWEPFTSMLGNSAFLIESNTYAVDPPDPAVPMQRYGVAFQKVDGGAPVEGEAFFSDDAKAYRGPINNYRQNGNPGRVAGDRRPGAVNFIAGGEGNPDEFDAFRSDDRWDIGVTRGGRYGVVQTHSLDSRTLEQRPLSQAIDAINGRLTQGDAAGKPQIGRFGGDMACLSDGNFVVVVDDRSQLHEPVDRAATAVIVAPDGSIVKDSFVIGAGEIWSNVASFQGGFCVRLNGMLKFYDNAGDLQGEANQDDARITDPNDPNVTLFAFDRGRGDGTRIDGHVNSPFVFMAGRNNEEVKDVRLAVWDSRDLTFVGSINVNELTPANGGTDAGDFRPALDRVNLTVDALNRVAVAYEVRLDEFPAQQTVVRVLAFDGGASSFKYLTPSFFPFASHGAPPDVGPFRTFRPSVALTTRQICVAAKGEINREGKPELGPDTPGETNFYTVITHPDPQPDPTLPATGPGRLVPGGLDSAGLAGIVPDTPIYLDGEGRGALGNWEPFTSVLGNSAFLIESNTYAVDPPDPAVPMQRYGVAFQKVDGGAPVEGEVFFSDDAKAYRGPINNYRQNGNPGRVAGDRRPGAVNFIAGGEGNPDELDPFRSDDRWDTGVTRGGRYGVVQTHSLDPKTLEQTPRSKAFDAINGRLTQGDAAGKPQIGRFGGDMACLSDGNFVVVVDDRSQLHEPVDRAATAVIVAPDGSIVKDSFVIGAGEIWSNVASFQGGFCVRLNGMLKFYDNAGTFRREVDQDEAKIVDPCNGKTLFAFDRGRGDGTRLGAHVNSPYVFLVGRNNEAVKDVRLAAWDSRDLSFLGSINVNELIPANGGTDAADFRPALDRVNLAVDALDRVAVAYEVKLDEFPAQQTAVRVLAFDGAARTFRYLTPSFFPFQSRGAPPDVGPFRTFRPSVAMTTRQICVAAKGEINREGKPELGPDTPGETNFYTVFTHPDPRPDPTPPAPVAGESQLPGDCNQDGRNDLSDAICLLGYLFLGSPVVLPCDAGLVANPANIRLLDFNGDLGVDLSDAIGSLTWQFLGGPPHVRGERCSPIQGCPDVCVP